jgi:hypothetical protein
LRLTEPDQRLTTLGTVEIANELDSVGEQPQGLGGGEALEGALSCPDGVVGCLRLVDRHGSHAPVKREFRQAIARVLAV